MQDNQQQLVTEAQLSSLAKKFREAAGKNRAETARELGVARPSVQQAEANPELSLFKLRKRIIEHYSTFEVEGPFFRLKERSTTGERKTKTSSS